MSNFVTSLHNHYQRTGRDETHLISYLFSSDGPSNEATWKAECKIAGVVKGTGVGATKIEAKQIAAEQAWNALGLNGA